MLLLYFFNVLVFWWLVMWDLGSRPGIKPCTSAFEGKVLITLPAIIELTFSSKLSHYYLTLWAFISYPRYCHSIYSLLSPEGWVKSFLLSILQRRNVIYHWQQRDHCSRCLGEERREIKKSAWEKKNITISNMDGSKDYSFSEINQVKTNDIWCSYI